VNDPTAIASDPLFADAEIGRAGDMRDAAVAEGKQVLGGHARAEAVVDLHEWHRRRVDVAVETDDWQPFAHEVRDPVGRKHEAVDKHAVDLLRTQQREVLLLALGISLGRAEQHRVAGREGAPLDAADELGVERVCDVRQQQRDRLRRFRDEAARDRVRAVPELLHGGVDHRARVRRNPGGAVQRPRDSRRRDAGEARDVVDRWPRGLHAAEPNPL
jgi:hypothetical protein